MSFEDSLNFADETTQTSSTNASEYSVTELSASLKRTVEDAFGHIRVRGEISGYRGPHSSGHAYFALKDEKSRLEAVIWRGQLSKMRVKPEEGMEVVATGKLTTYAGSSKYQIVIDKIEPAGAGALMVLLEKRRQKLAAEGLFAEARKQLLPVLPMRIGVITSPTGAVIRDILHRVQDRFPCHVIVWPVRVQGDTSGKEVSNAIKGFNSLEKGQSISKPDLIIVARGGGSLEDLWGFNDEDVVRAVADSDIPIISAIGHETDWTLIDYAADVRAPTPTGATEMALPVRRELIAYVQELGVRNHRALDRQLNNKKTDLRAASNAFPKLDTLLTWPRQNLDMMALRLGNAFTNFMGQRQKRYIQMSSQLKSGQIHQLIRMKENQIARIAGPMRQLVSHKVAQERQKLTGVTQLLNAVSYKRVLARGFALVKDQNGQIISRASALKDNQHIQLQFDDALRQAVALGEVKTPKHTKKPSAQSGRQPSLFDET